MKELEKIPQNSKIAIYGAGEAGILVKNYIKTNRPDLYLVCFFDKLPKGDIDGVKVYSIEEITNQRGLFDYVIIASYLNYSIMEAVLNHLGIKNYIRPCSLPMVSKNKNSRIEEVQKILFSNQSKEVFELVVNAYTCKNCLETLSRYLKDKNEQIYPKMHEQYFDFINQDIIKTIISGGAYDGGTTVLFLDRFKNAEKILAFDPMYPKFKNAVTDRIIKEHPKIEIVEKGLFDKSVKIGFNDFGTSSKINLFSPADGIDAVDMVAIDDFVKEKNIQKVDFIKMDLEGCETAALKGAENTLKTHRPQLAICIYHSFEELFEIPLYLKSVLENYKFEVYHYSLNSNWETVFYAIPDEIFNL